MTQGRSSDRGTGPRRVPIRDVVANPLNPRDDDDPELEQLVATLRSAGQLQPIMVVSKERYLRAYPEQAAKIPGAAKWVTLGGNRRLAAARRAERRRIDVHEVEYDTRDEILRAILIENGQRKGLSPLKEGQALKALMDGPDRTVRSLAEFIGKSPAYVQQRLDLLKLIPQFQELLNSEKIGIKAARSIAIKSEDEQRRIFAERNRASSAEEDALHIDVLKPAVSAIRRVIAELESVSANEQLGGRLAEVKGHIVAALELLESREPLE